MTSQRTSGFFEQIISQISICNFDIIWTKSERWETLNLKILGESYGALVAKAIKELNILKQDIETPFFQLEDNLLSSPQLSSVKFSLDQSDDCLLYTSPSPRD